MRVRAADEMGKGHALQLDVVDVAAFTSDETPVFLAQHAGANTFNTHILVSLPEFVFPAVSIEIRRSPIEQSVVGRGYSAACATFMRPAASSTDLTMLW